MQRQKAYWANACIACSQVFLGIAAATLFAGVIDITKAAVIACNLVLAFCFLILGWKLTT